MGKTKTIFRYVPLSTFLHLSPLGQPSRSRCRNVQCFVRFTFTRSKVMVLRLSVVETKCQSRTRRSQWQPLGHLQRQGEEDFLSCVHVYAAFSRQTSRRCALGGQIDHDWLPCCHVQSADTTHRCVFRAEPCILTTLPVDDSGA